MIIFPGIDWLVFTKRQREAIKRLKQERDFRSQGLWFRIVIVLSMSILLVIFATVHLVYADPEAGAYGFASKYFVPPVTYLVALWVLKFLRHEAWFLPTAGQLVDGLVTNVDHKRATIAPRWEVTFSYPADQSSTRSKTVSIGDVIWNGRSPAVGDQVYVFVDPLNGENANLYVPSIFPKLCLSQSRFLEFSQLPFLRSKTQ